MSVRTCDEGHLRSAVAAAGAWGTVRFRCSGTITLAATIAISQDLTIDGSGQAVTISGGSSVEAFAVSPSVTVALNHLTIATASGRDYGIQNYGRLRVTYSTFSLNSASGGGIQNYGTLTVTASTLSGRDTNGPGIENYGMLTVTGSAFRLNSAGWPDIENFGRLSASNNTFSGDSANAYGGGIQDFGCVSRLPVCS